MSKMTQIPVDEDIYALLKAQARPFVDTCPNDVLRRLLIDGEPAPVEPIPTATPLKTACAKISMTTHRRGGRSASKAINKTRGALTIRTRDCQRHLLAELYEMGGEGRSTELAQRLLDKQFEKSKHLYELHDFARGVFNLAVMALIREGLVFRPRKVGVLQLTSKGIATIEERLNLPRSSYANKKPSSPDSALGHRKTKDKDSISSL